MKLLVTALSAGALLAASSASAVFYDELPDVERNFSDGTYFRSVTHYMDNGETVELDPHEYEAFKRERDTEYDPHLYFGN